MFAVSFRFIQTGIFNGFTRSAKLIDNLLSRYLGSLRELGACGPDAANPTYKPNPGSTGGERGAGRSASVRGRHSMGEMSSQCKDLIQTGNCLYREISHKEV